MEKPPAQPRSKGSKILKFLPKATSFSIPNRPFSPGRDRAHAHKGFSGPIISIVPAEARRKPSGRGGYETPEATSPKVSCIGQIKHKKKKACSARAARPPLPTARAERKPGLFGFGRIFRGTTGKGKRSGGGAEKPSAAPAAGRAPVLGQMRRFASGRDALANFDWKSSRVADESGEDDSGYFYTDGEEDSDVEVIIPHSAPILLGGGAAAATLEPRKEVNLWKRRTVAPPRSLQVE